jgi:hypothetical protein
MTIQGTTTIARPGCKYPGCGQLRADLRARAERAERQADDCRDELDRLRSASPGNGNSAEPASQDRAARSPRPGHLTRVLPWPCTAGRTI